MFQRIKDAWKAVKAWFNHAWSILIARVTSISGLVIAAVSSTDWSSLIAGVQGGLTWTVGTTMGAIIFIHGVISELGRRQGTVTLKDGQLMPLNVSAKVEAIKVIKEETAPQKKAIKEAKAAK